MLDTLDIILRLSAAALIGCALGLNRELRNKAAGMRTHAMVAIGAALVTLTAIYLSRTDPTADAISRVIQGIVAGVGFLGAGAILKTDREYEIRGLTTAATIWVVASLGIACGAGFWVAALAALVISLLVLILGEPVERFVKRVSPSNDEGK